jgi:HK97 family phage portal protein
MGYGIRDGDIIALNNEKAGALTLSVPIQDYRGTELDPETLWLAQPNIRTVVDFVTTTIAGVPFNLYDRDGDNGRTRNYVHPVARALKTPGPKQGQKRWIQQIMFDRLIYDRWAAMIYYRDDGGFDLLRLPAERITFITDSLDRFVEIGIWIDGELRTRPLDDIVFDVGVGPTRKNRKPGFSALRTLSDLALELQGMSEYRANLFRNSAMVPAVIERPADAPKWSDDGWKRFKAEFAQYRAGGGNAGGTPLLEDGMKLKPVDVFNPKDSQYIEVRQLALVEAAQAMRIPPELVGAKDGTHSNIVALREQLYVDVLGPEFGFLEDALNVGLAHVMKPNQYIEADLGVKLRGSLADRARIYQTASGRPWLTTNEVRAMENKPAVENGDELVTPLNVLTGGQASPADGGTTDPEDLDDDGQEKIPAPKAVGRKAATPNKWSRIDAASEALAADAVSWWHGYARRWADRLGVDLDEQDGKSRRKALPALPDPEEMIDEAEGLATLLLHGLKAAADAGSDVVLMEFNPDAENFDPGRQMGWLERTSTREALAYDARTYDAIADAMRDPATWTEGVRRVLSNDSTITAWTVGLATEAASFGETDAAKASGLKSKTWHTGRNPRPSHKAQNGVTVEIDDYFPNFQRYPGDWQGGIEEVANCNCRLSFNR